MGNELSNGTPTDLESMKRYQGMSPGQVQLIKEKFELMADEDLTIDKSAFTQLMKLKENEVDKIFSYFDLSNDGRIDSHEFICALALISQAPLKEKAEIVFSLYDFDHNRTITKNELVILIKTSLTSLGAMSQKGECTIQEAEQKADDILRRYDTNKDSTISLKEFQSFISKDPDILRMLFSYGIISAEDMRIDFGGAEIGELPEPDSDLEREVNRQILGFDQKIERKKVGIDHKQGVHDEIEEDLSAQTYQQFQQGRKGGNTRLWLNQVKNGAPSNWKPGKGDIAPPTTWLDLDYIYGFRCFDIRNNLKITTNGELVYPVAAVGVCLDTQRNQQKFFLEHTDDITCLDVYENLIVTGQVGTDPLICVWESGQVSRCVFRGILKIGVAYVAFSNDGKKIVAVGMDPDHCIVVYDVDKALSSRGQGKKDEFLISSGKGPRSEVFDVKFDKVDKNIILACKNEVYFATYDNFIIKLNKGLWDQKTCPFSAVLCIGTAETNIITGTFRGFILIWRGNRATQSIDAHHGPVLAIHSRKTEPGFITGGRDGQIIIWEGGGNIKIKTKFLIQELNLKVLNSKISAITENAAGTCIMIGTRGSDIIEVQGTKNRLVMRGHSEGTLRGLTVHHKLQQFYTIGEDNVLACWFIKEKKMMSCVKLDYPSRTLNISQDSRFLAVGSLNGTVLIIDPKTLIPTFNFKDRDAEVSCIKFSHDTEILAVGHCPPACEIILYSIKNHFKKTNVLRGSPATILSIDFSVNCKILQVNDQSCQVLYYEILGEGNQKVQPDGSLKNRDERWATYTARYGWHVQGVWPEVSSGSDINAVDRSSKGDILVTADDYSSIKLFRFPAPATKQGYHRYSGHSAHVTNVKFTADDEYIISLGGLDKSIIQWKFNFDKDTQVELDQSSEQIADQSIQVEYLRTSPTQNQEEEAKGDGQMKQYLGPVKATVPTQFKPDLKRDNQLPNGNLELAYIFGCKTNNYDGEALNLIKYTQNLKVVYPAGCVGVMLDSKIDKNGVRPQTFFRQHKEDINAIAIHPKGHMVATGGRAFGLTLSLVPIHLWEADTKRVVSSLIDFHLKSIVALAFTPDGAFLVSAGGDDDNSIAVHDWTTNQLLCASKTGQSTITGIVLRSQTEFITCGQKSVKFFTMNGRNLKCIPGGIGGIFEPMAAVTIAFQSNECITGSLGGNLYHWKDNQGQKPVNGHASKVTSLVPFKNQLYSAGLDGKINVWTFNQVLTLLNCIVDTIKLFKQPLLETKPGCMGIISMDIQDSMAIICTKSAEIYEITLEQQPKGLLVMQGHFDGELWGAACSPNSSRCVTCGGDSVLRLWDLETKKPILVSKLFDNDIRGVDWSNSGTMIAVGDVKGTVYLVDATTLQVMDKKASKFAQQKSRNNMVWIEDIKFSPDNQKIAFGAHTQASHLEIYEIEGGKLSKQILVNLNLQGSLVHLDWSTDSVNVVINSSNYELKFVNILKTKEVPAPTVKDLEWQTWTCSLGFPVQGIYHSKEEYDIVSTCATNSKQILAAGEFNGRISLYKYPAVCPPPQQSREYFGHSSQVTRLRFTYDDSMLISTSSLDQCVFVWSTNFGKGQVLEQVEEAKYDDQDDVHDFNLIQEKVRRFGPEKYGKLKKKDTQKLDQIGDEQQFGAEVAEKGDEFISIKPWMGAIKEPSNYYKDPLNQNKAPLVDFQIDYVHGYRSKDCRNNIRYLKNGSIVYNAAALGVQLDPITNVQKFFNKHDDDVLCIDIHPDGIKVATGQTGAKPTIYVWDSNTQQPLCSFKGQLTKGVLALSFNLTGDKLAAVGLDDSHQIVVYDVQAKSKTGGVMLCKDRIGPDIITSIKWKNDLEFVTVGINHFKCWQLSVGGLSYKKGVLCKTGASTKYLSANINNDDWIIGASDGTLQVYKGNTFANSYPIHDNGKALEALYVSKEFVVTGGKDMKLNLLDTKGTYKILLTVKILETVKGALTPEIKSVCISPDSKSILIGTAGCEIYELTTKDAKITPNSKLQQFKPLIRGHNTPNRRTLNEVWGLAVNPNDQDQYYTCSDDGTLRAWSISQKKMINLTKTNIDANGNEMKTDENGELVDSVKGRSIGVSPDGIYVVVGFKEGTIRLFDKELKQKLVLKCAKEWISDIKFSHDSQSLAIGSHDNTIYVYTFPDMKLKNKPLRKHASYITHLDFSVDGNYLHSNCGGYELLFWDVNQGKQLPTGASTLRDEKWYSWTAPLGWPVQGIWPELADGTDINTVDRSHNTVSGSDKPPDNYYLLASGDDMSNIKLFRYPCVKKGPQYLTGKGHSSHVTNVRFSNDDQYLFSTGGEDNVVIQWKLLRRR